MTKTGRTVKKQFSQIDMALIDMKELAKEKSILQAKHVLHSAISHPLLRTWQSLGVEITANNLMYPIFVTDGSGKEQVIPNIYRYGCDELEEMLIPLVEKGLQSVLLFGVIKNLPKDTIGTHADSPNNPVIQAIKIIRKRIPNLLIACDVCLCPYTNDGHCGIRKTDGTIDNKKSIQRIAEIAAAYATAGAHVVAPSDMMDGRVAAIKQVLQRLQLSNKVSVLSYAVKFASIFYGPFREISQSAPKDGDRRTYQLPPGSSGLAARAASRDVEEGADMIMVKPGLPYLDIVRRTKDAHPEYPLFVYQVSGEYAMLHHAAKEHVFKLEDAVRETIVAMRRAGADCIITYFTPLLLDMLNQKSKL